MIRIVVNIEGEQAWLLRRIECVFRGHEWTQWYGGGKSTPAITWTGCGRCRKKQAGSERPREDVQP